MYGERRGAYRVILGKRERADHLKDTGVDGRIILKRIFEKWVGRARTWVDQAQDRNRWQAFVNAVINLRVP
jgi:hypothetical protein